MASNDENVGELLKKLEKLKNQRALKEKKLQKLRRLSINRASSKQKTSATKGNDVPAAKDTKTSSETTSNTLPDIIPPTASFEETNIPEKSLTKNSVDNSENKFCDNSHQNEEMLKMETMQIHSNETVQNNAKRPNGNSESHISKKCKLFDESACDVFSASSEKMQELRVSDVSETNLASSSPLPKAIAEIDCLLEGESVDIWGSNKPKRSEDCEEKRGDLEHTEVDRIINSSEKKLAVEVIDPTCKNVSLDDTTPSQARIKSDLPISKIENSSEEKKVQEDYSFGSDEKYQFSLPYQNSDDLENFKSLTLNQSLNDSDLIKMDHNLLNENYSCSELGLTQIENEKEIAVKKLADTSCQSVQSKNVQLSTHNDKYLSENKKLVPEESLQSSKSTSDDRVDSIIAKETTTDHDLNTDFKVVTNNDLTETDVLCIPETEIFFMDSQSEKNVTVKDDKNTVPINYDTPGSRIRIPTRRKLWSRKSVGNIFKTDTVRVENRCENVGEASFEVIEIPNKKSVKENRVEREATTIGISTDSTIKLRDDFQRELLNDLTKEAFINLDKKLTDAIESEVERKVKLLKVPNTKQLIDLNEDLPSHAQKCVLNEDATDNENSTYPKFICCLNGGIQEDILDLHFAVVDSMDCLIIQYETEIHIWKHDADKRWSRRYIYKVDNVLSVSRSCVLSGYGYLVLIMLFRGTTESSLKFLHFGKDLRDMKALDSSYKFKNGEHQDKILLCSLDDLLFATAEGKAKINVFLHAFTDVESNPSITTASLGKSLNNLQSICRISNSPNALLGIGEDNLYIWNLCQMRLVAAVELKPRIFLPIDICFWAIVENGLFFFLTTCKDADSENLCQMLVANMATGFCESVLTYSICPSEEKKHVKNRFLNPCYCKPFLTLSHQGSGYIWSVTEEKNVASLGGNAMVVRTVAAKQENGSKLIATGLDTGCIHLYELTS